MRIPKRVIKRNAVGTTTEPAVNDSDDMRWHEAGDIVKSPAVEQVVGRALMYLEAGYSLHLSGPPGAGKTAVAMHLAKHFNRPYVVLHGDASRGADQMRDQASTFERKYVRDNFVRDVVKEAEKTSLKYNLSAVQNACINGHFLIYDEFNRSRPEVNNILLPVLSEGIIPMNQNDQDSDRGYQQIDPHFRLITTSNPDDTAGTFHTQDALLDRMVTITLEGWDQETELAILRFHSGANEADATKIIEIIHRIRREVQSSVAWPSIRSGIMLAKIIKNAQIEFDPSDKIFQIICRDVFNADAVSVVRSGNKSLRKTIHETLDEIFKVQTSKSVRIAK